ncbi:uncharacterized protein LOC141588255 [Silene latifolia]|uniref:uncharacterized protein LOC141588255 n=1 Tax=Silene latifolia TaxID=37657 RepID=UPI003D775C38
MDAWILEYDECISLIKEVWKRRLCGTPAYQVARKLSMVRQEIRHWALDKRQEWQQKWDDFDSELERGMDAAINDGNDDMYMRVNDKVREFAKVAAVFWRQRAKLKWMIEGDTCTKYFFNWVKGRAGRNFILGIKNGNGNWIYEPDLVGEIFYESFYNLYNPPCTDNGPVRENLMEEVLMGINKTVHGDDCDVLSRPFTAQEVRTAVFQMGALKSPGPDGVPAIFYQKCWYFIKKDVTRAVLSVLNSGMVLKELNRTFITLIPKCDNPETVGDYRPISLCNVFMRIVSKCITNRMAIVMGYLVGDFQNAFIPGRQISDNIILANEALHKINLHKKGKSGRYAFKADMSKAYDRVRWDFLRAVLYKFGVPKILILLIMNCVTTVSYQVLFNGAPLRLFQPHCGLRQGDPLSPYLFVLCMEVLSCNVLKAQQRGLLKGITLCRGVEALSHLFFADDAIFFLHDRKNSTRNLRAILNKYCKVSGQVMNEDKSGILFSPSTTLARARCGMRNLRVKGTKGLGKYLGLPTDLQGSKRELFRGLIDIVMKRISSWNGIFLTPAGRLTLITSVLSNISNYFLSVFKIPVSVTNKINSLLSHFWWAGGRLGRTIHWCSHKFLSLPKREGGLGIRNIECLNQAMLGKHAWRIISGDQSFFARIFRKKLLGEEVLKDNWVIQNGNNLSWGARSILHGLDFVRNQIGWKPGLDSEMNVWTNKWVNGYYPEPKDDCLGIDRVGLQYLMVKDLQINGQGREIKWNEVFLHTFLVDDSVKAILAKPICRSQTSDEVYWLHNSDGQYSVKSGYGILFHDFMLRRGSVKDKERLSRVGLTFCRQKLWKLSGPPTWKILLWRILTNTLSVGINFVKRNIEIDPSCKFCKGREMALESMEHLFRDCPVSRRLWAGSELGIRTNQTSFLQIDSWIIDWMVYLEKSEGREEQQIRFLATLWCIWSTRNQILFQGVDFHPIMFFKHWSQIVSTGIQAIKEIKKGDCALEGNSTSLARDNANWVRNSNPICVVGRIGDCRYVRVMVDAGWKGFDKAGVGWIAMSENGYIFHSMEKKIMAESALQAEGLGVLLVLRWACERGLHHLEISSDCLSLILQLAGMERRQLIIKTILEEISDCFSYFHCLAFSYVPRRFNHDADRLACKAMDS